MEKLCHCKGCRFSDSHITSYHKCGTCNGYGHGQFECHKNNNDDNSKTNSLHLLIMSKPKKILQKENWCKIKDCKTRYTHNTNSHQDFFSEDLYGDYNGPDYYGIRKRNEDAKINGARFIKDKNNSFVKIYWGMSDFVYTRNKNGVIESKVMGIDSHNDEFVAGLKEYKYNYYY